MLAGGILNFSGTLLGELIFSAQGDVLGILIHFWGSCMQFSLIYSCISGKSQKPLEFTQNELCPFKWSENVKNIAKLIYLN